MNDQQYIELRLLVDRMIGKVRELEGEIMALQALVVDHEIATPEELLKVRQKARNLVFDPNLDMRKVVSGKHPGELLSMPPLDKQ